MQLYSANPHPAPPHRTRKSRWTRTALLASLLLLGLAPAQSRISLYGGVFRSGQQVKVEADAPAGTVFTLERLLDPERLFVATQDPHRPQVPAGTPTARVRSVRLSRSGGSTLDFGALPSGVYLVRSGGTGTVVLVTALGLVVKRDQESALTYTADQGSGQTRAAQVWALGAGTAKAQASADGLATFKRPAHSGEVYLAHFGNDWAISGASWNSYAAPLVRGYVYTDRPVYRPGQHVDFKAVLRRAGSLAPLGATPVRVVVSSPFDDELLRRTLTTDAYGSLSGGLDLPAGGQAGRVPLHPLGAGRGRGRAERHRRNLPGGGVPEAGVRRHAEAQHGAGGAGRQGEHQDLGALPCSGGALGGAKLTYSVTRAPYYPPGFDAETLPPDQQDQGPDYGSDLVIQEDTRLGAGGDLDLSLPLARDDKGQPVSYRIQAEVQDESRRTVSAQTQVIAFPAALNVQASTDNYIYDVGSPLRVTLDTRDLNDSPRAAPVTLDLVRQNWNKLGGRWTQSETRISRTQLRTGAGGLLTAALRAPRGGGYLIRASVHDAQGRSSTAESFVWVLKPGEDWGWNYNDLTVQLDRKKYAPGDTATVLIGNPTPGAAVLVTLEGDRLRRSTVLRGQGAVLSYRFPVTADMSPNIFVSAAALGGGKFYSHETSVKVPRAGAALSVTVKPSKPRSGPGEKASFSVDVRNAAGQGVPAQLAFGVVDQAIYLVQPDTSTPLLQVFSAARDNAVGTDTSANFYFEQSAPASSAPAPKPMSEAAFAQSKDAASRAAPSDQQPVNPRQNFKDTLLWIPNLLTDAQGHADVPLTYPDNLTTWIATARAHTREPRFGQATASALVTKDVIARLSLPPFLVRGDTVTLSGLVNNTLPKAVSGTAQLSLSGLSGLSGAALTPAGTPVQLAANGRVRSDVQVRADTVGTAQVTFTARTPSGNDALRLPLPVRARGYDETQTAVGDGATPLRITLPRDANAQTATLRLDLTPSLLGSVGGALEYLVGYPYGCTEQTMSRFLPALLARQSLGTAGLPASVTRDLPAITDAGLARLSLFQHEDGGWNFWQWDDSTLEMSAYVTQGLLRARALGAAVDNKMLDRALNYLAGHLNSKGARQADQASALRALQEAGRVKPGQLSAFARRAELEPYALAQTALALGRAGQTQAARDVLDRLKARRVGSGALIHWETPRRAGQPDDWYDYWDDNSIQVTAAALEALARLEPGSPLIPGVSQWLLRSRRGPQWLSTQDTTSVIIAALALKPGVAAAKTSNVQVALDGQAVGTLSVQGGRAATLNLPARRLTAGAHTLTLAGAPAGALAAAQLSYAREPATLSGDQSRGLLLSRRYERLDPVWDAAKQRYSYRRTPLLRAGQLQPVTSGDLILVTLTVQPTQHSARYLLVSDPVPAGMKALDERSLAVVGLPDPDADSYDPEGWNYWYAGRDLLDDRVDLYADYLAGRQSITYLLRAQTPGTFTALPTHAFLMYDPQVQGYGAAATLTVRDQGQ